MPNANQLEEAQASEIEAEASAGEENRISPELRAALLKYVLQSYRILLAHEPATWNNFHNANEENFENFDLTVNELCALFQKQVLPDIYQTELTTTEQRLLKLLDNHPFYKRTDNGYVLLEQQIEQCFDQSLVDGVEVRIVQQGDEIDQELGHQTLAVNKQCDVEKMGFNRCISGESSALLSLALLNKYELSNCTLLPPAELGKRLRSAKQQFERVGDMPRSHLKLRPLLEDLQKMQYLRNAITEIISNRFF